MSTRKPSLEQTIRALLMNVAVVEAGELADALEETSAAHYSTQRNADRSGHYGACVTCREPWPCPTWRDAAQAGHEWVWAAAQVLLAKYGKVAPPLDDPAASLELIHRRRQEAA